MKDIYMKLKRNSFKTVLKQFWNCSVSVSFRYADSLTVDVAGFDSRCLAEP